MEGHPFSKELKQRHVRGRNRVIKSDFPEKRPSTFPNPTVPTFCQAILAESNRVESNRVEQFSLSLSLSGLRVSSQWHEQPDARASTLDLSVLRSSRIARNSSYFVLIRKFVLVQLSRDSTLLPRIANFFSLVSLFVARRANFISPRPRLFHLASPHPPRFQFGTRSEIVPSYLRAISLKCLVRGNWNVDEPIRRWNSRLIFSYELTLIEFHYRQLTKNGKLRLKMIRCAW